jgi:hypothetical protein
VNLQYDLKEVKLDLEQAKAAADVTTVLPTSVVHDAALTKDLSDSLQRVRGLEEEVSRLRCEKEATEQTNAQVRCGTFLRYVISNIISAGLLA